MAHWPPERKRELIEMGRGSVSSADEKDGLFSWEAEASAGRMEEAVVAYIRRKDWVTFCELMRYFEPYMETEGQQCLYFGSDPNLILWVGMSEAFCRLMIDVQAKGRVFWHPSCRLTYLIDGCGCNLPAAKSIPKAGYKKPHWLPVCLRLVPVKGAKGQQKPPPVTSAEEGSAG